MASQCSQLFSIKTTTYGKDYPSAGGGQGGASRESGVSPSAFLGLTPRDILETRDFRGFKVN